MGYNFTGMMNRVQKRLNKTLGSIGLIALCLGGWFILSHWNPAQAAPPGQIPILTPTPGPDGRIIYIVKTNDTLLSISLIMGIPVEKLRALNNLTGDTIYPGQKLMLGLGGPTEVTFTPGPSPTPTPLLPTPSPKPGSGTLCILLYDDVNGDSIRQTSELSLAGGAISFGNRAGTISETRPTQAGQEAQCFPDLPEGDYTISVAIPAGYNATTQTSYNLPLNAGDQNYLNFGAQANSQTLAQAPAIPAPEGSKSPILGILGALFLLSGVGFALFARRLIKGK
jgi:hypothetical protein